MSLDPIAWMVAPPPRMPAEWPHGSSIRHGLDVDADAVPYTDSDLQQGWSPDDVVAWTNTGSMPPLVVAAVAAGTGITRNPTTESDARRQKRERDAAAMGEFFLPLQPGQSRRRRAGPDGQPLRRGGYNKGGYKRPHLAKP